MSPSLNRIVLSFAVAVSCTIGGIEGAEAQRAASKAPAAKAASKAAPAASDTDRALDGAAKALESGNADAAMSALEGILSGGGLSNPHMARALYLRGLAHRAKGRQAQAIADLTSAVWLKDGLNEKDRTAALNARSEASREVGVAAPATGSAAVTQAPSAPPQAAAPARTAAAPRPFGGAVLDSESGFSAYTPPARVPPPPSAPAASSTSSSPSPNSGPATSSWQSSTTVDAREGRRAPQTQQQTSVVTDAPPPPTASSSPAPASRPAAAPPASGGGIGSFFKGLFTGGSIIASAPQSDAGGSSQWRPRTERAAAPETPAEPRARSAAETRTAKVAQPKAAKSTAPIATSAVASGAYRLQIATVRSRKEADAVAARVRKEHAGAIGNRRLEVDETVFGGMGKFYRVRLGPYADVREPKTFCEQLRPEGYDCLVVTN